MDVIKDGITGEVLYRQRNCPLRHGVGGNGSNIAFTRAGDAFRYAIEKIAVNYIGKGRGNSSWQGVCWGIINYKRIGHIGMVRYMESSHSLEFSFFNAGSDDHAAFHAWCNGGKVGGWEDDVLMRMNSVKGTAKYRNLIVVSAANIERAIEILAERAVRH